ncbi:uncharacterized protein N7482_000952 [Penicillium canariense]|uniref:Uncharacterized protein n=1 Tax=Penicillium canariense TaxID=189055 RepID=A0A9W9IFM8_9EURO|nr:uncharacterized protein N7482_000952 [Penicillium canariense]KAJ5175075.1 hypothetical protein N7482_000952 [Penicillium canariense]
MALPPSHPMNLNYTAVTMISESSIQIQRRIVRHFYRSYGAFGLSKTQSQSITSSSMIIHSTKTLSNSKRHTSDQRISTIYRTWARGTRDTITMKRSIVKRSVARVSAEKQVQNSVTSSLTRTRRYRYSDPPNKFVHVLSQETGPSAPNLEKQESKPAAPTAEECRLTARRFDRIPVPRMPRLPVPNPPTRDFE